MMFHSLYTLRVAWNSLLVSNFYEFLEFLFIFFHILGVLLHIFLYTRVVTLYAFNEFVLLIYI